MRKVVALISGGIDSPVAAYLMLKKGIEVVAIHFDNQPCTDHRPREKAIMLTERLGKIFNKKIKLYILPHGNNQIEFARKCERRLECVLCRRLMMRIASAVSVREGAMGIVTGESLGQVASQTLTNLQTISQAVDIPIIRPLIGMDKEEIIATAKKIGTYDTSILSGLCCTITPENPETSARLPDVLRNEALVDIPKMMSASLDNMVIV